MLILFLIVGCALFWCFCGKGTDEGQIQTMSHSAGSQPSILHRHQLRCFVPVHSCIHFFSEVELGMPEVSWFIVLAFCSASVSPRLSVQAELFRPPATASTQLLAERP